MSGGVAGGMPGGFPGGYPGGFPGDAQWDLQGRRIQNYPPWGGIPWGAPEEMVGEEPEDSPGESPRGTHGGMPSGLSHSFFAVETIISLISPSFSL